MATKDITNDVDLSGLSEGAKMSASVAKPYIVDMLEQLMLLSHGANLNHLANGLEDLLEPYRNEIL